MRYTYAVRYGIEAECMTPLRCGNGETENVLRSADGRMFVQGTSIAGALREWLSSRITEKQLEELMGAVGCRGRMIVSDGELDLTAQMTIRPHVRLDGATQSAADGGKFDIAHISPGTKLYFDIYWLGTKMLRVETGLIEQALQALNQGMIRLGAQKSNGFGRLKIQVKKQNYDLKTDLGRKEWISDHFEGVPICLEENAQRERAVFTVQAYTDGLLIKSGAAVQETEGSVTKNIQENGKAVIPGSSIKGAVIARIHAIARLLAVPESVLDEAFGRCTKEAEKPMPCRFVFEDAYPDGDSKKITRIHIDRLTGGVIRGGLFREEPVAGSIMLRITAPIDMPKACALMLYALRDLGAGLFNLGGNEAIGRGFLHVKKITAVLDAKRSVLSFDERGNWTLEDEAGLAEEWINALQGGKEHEN